MYWKTFQSYVKDNSGKYLNKLWWFQKVFIEELLGAFVSILTQDLAIQIWKLNIDERNKYDAVYAVFCRSWILKDFLILLC